MLQQDRETPATVVVLFSLILLPTLTVLASDDAPLASDETVTIGLETTASTWRARGRVSFPVAAAIRTRLAHAGVQVAPPADPEAQTVPVSPGLTLKVDYREARGQQVSLDIYGTEVTCTIVLMHAEDGTLLHLTITEAPSYGSLSTLPYVDVIHRLETHPYFYFLGYLVQGAIGGRTPAASLLTAVMRQVEGSPPAGTDPSPDALDVLPTFGPHYELEALGRAIEELARLKEPGTVPVITTLLVHPDWRIRIRAVLALETLGVKDSPALMEVAQRDRDHEVRQAAQRVLSRSQRPLSH
jgi:hypothetical protein